MPLCTRAIRPSLEVCGWALTSFGPPGVADAQPVAGQRLPGEEVLQVAQLAGLLRREHLPISDDGHARGVVTAILQPAQAVDHDIEGGLRADVPDDSTHAG